MTIKKFRELLLPRFTISDMENSHTRCGCEYEIATIVFDDGLPHLPKLAMGKIIISRKIKFTVMWNKEGECILHGKHIKSFDLIRPTHKINDVVKPLIAGITGMIIFSIISY